MTEPARIVAVGAASGSLRLAAEDVAAAWHGGAARGQVAACAPDEDTLTLAWDAAVAALDAAGLDGSSIDGLWWGTSRPPFGEGPSHAVLANALGLGTTSAGALHAGSAHAGAEALLAAADAVGAGTARRALVVVSDAIVPGLGTDLERRAGAAAAAAVLGADGPATITARVTRTRPALDRYRGAGESGTRDPYDARLFREEIFLPVLREITEHLAAFVPRTWSLPDPDGRSARAVARGLDGTVGSEAVVAAVGDAGAAAALLGAATSLDAAGIVASVGYGGGRATGVVFDALGPVPGAAAIPAALDGGRRAPYAEVLRVRGQLVAAGEKVEMGVPPGSAMFTRGSVEMLGPLGARCIECGTINTPPSIHPHCIRCGAEKFEDVALSGRGSVHTFVINETMPAPFVAPLPLAVIDLDDGARVMLQVTGEADDLAIGAPVELVLRRYAHERGVPVYGFKARLATGSGA